MFYAIINSYFSNVIDFKENVNVIVLFESKNLKQQN